METERWISRTTEETTGLDQPQAAVEAEKPQRIGGVLIIIAIGLAISLIQNLSSCLSSLTPVFKRSVWERVTDPQSLAYHPYWKPILIYEAVTTAAFLLMNVVMLWLFFRKKKLFQRLVVILIPLIFVLSLTGYYFSGFIPAIAESAEYAKQGRELIIKFVALHVWIPYFLLSKRVERTFVR